ncbi:MAG: hypothetical protein JNL74_02685 [Fibrobacteres bacterium]|nr:hypothetical protein [Fibrobacterota bacterium]
MAQPNYQYEKRQKEIARKKKNDEKLRAKQNKNKSDTAPSVTPVVRPQN